MTTMTIAESCKRTRLYGITVPEPDTHPVIDRGDLDGIAPATLEQVERRRADRLAAVEAMLKPDPPRRPKPKRIPPLPPWTKPVTSDRGETWPSIAAAARALRAHRSAVGAAMRKGARCCGRRLWSTREGPPRAFAGDRDHPVVRVEDRQRFPTLRAAIVACGLDASTSCQQMRLVRAIQRRQPYAGYHFRDVKMRKPKAEQAA